MLIDGKKSSCFWITQVWAKKPRSHNNDFHWKDTFSNFWGVSYKNTYNRISYDKIVVKNYCTAQKTKKGQATGAVKLNDNNRCKKRNFQPKKVLVSYFRSDPDICPLHPLISPPSYTEELVCLWSFNLNRTIQGRSLMGNDIGSGLARSVVGLRLQFQ